MDHKSLPDRYVDREVPIFARMLEKRLRGTRAIGYTRNDPLNDGADPGEPPVDEGTAKTPAKSLTRKTRGPGRDGRVRNARSPTTAPW